MLLEGFDVCMAGKQRKQVSDCTAILEASGAFRRAMNLKREE